jgi:hypothetical protein
MSESSEPGVEYYKSYYERYYELLAKYNGVFEYASFWYDLEAGSIDEMKAAYEESLK